MHAGHLLGRQLEEVGAVPERDDQAVPGADREAVARAVRERVPARHAPRGAEQAGVVRVSHRGAAGRPDPRSAPRSPRGAWRACGRRGARTSSTGCRRAGRRRRAGGRSTSRRRRASPASRSPWEKNPVSVVRPRMARKSQSEYVLLPAGPRVGDAPPEEHGDGGEHGEPAHVAEDLHRVPEGPRRQVAEGVDPDAHRSRRRHQPQESVEHGQVRVVQVLLVGRPAARRLVRALRGIADASGSRRASRRDPPVARGRRRRRRSSPASSARRRATAPDSDSTRTATKVTSMSAIGRNREKTMGPAGGPAR